MAVLDRMRAAPAEDVLAPPDWTVTVAAIEREGEAICHHRSRQSVGPAPTACFIESFRVPPPRPPRFRSSARGSRR